MPSPPIEDNADLFMEWTSLFAMVMKIQKVPLVGGDPVIAAKYIIAAYERYLKSRGIVRKSYAPIEPD